MRDGNHPDWQKTFDRCCVVDAKEKQDIALFGYQVGVGLSYQGDCCGCFSIVGKVGYELTEWLDTPQIRRWYDNDDFFSSSPTPNHILLHGATARLGIVF